MRIRFRHGASTRAAVACLALGCGGGEMDGDRGPASQGTQAGSHAGSGAVDPPSTGAAAGMGSGGGAGDPGGAGAGGVEAGGGTAGQAGAIAAGGAEAGGAAGGEPAPSASAYDCSAADDAAPSAVKLTLLASGLSAPVGIKTAPGDDERLFVVERTGAIRIIRNGALVPAPFLDVSALVQSGYEEQGLLSVAFHPGYRENRRFFVYYTDRDHGDTQVVEYAGSDDPDVALPDPVRPILQQTQPTSGHNGGSLELGPDGLLFVSLGDGGDPTSSQNLGSLLGKILRLDVSAPPYAIPPGNMTGPGVSPEIWSYGLRNPWRATFDVCTGDMYIADVGQSSWEEVDVEPAGVGGRNYGWSVMEGGHCYAADASCDATGLTPPVLEYDHAQGCSVTGGYVYRGTKIPGLRGKYLFSDWCGGWLRWLAWRDGAPAESGSLDIGATSVSATSFGIDGSGEMYLAGGGSVYRIDPAE